MSRKLMAVAMVATLMLGGAAWGGTPLDVDLNGANPFPDVNTDAGMGGVAYIYTTALDGSKNPVNDPSSSTITIDDNNVLIIGNDGAADGVTIAGGLKIGKIVTAGTSSELAIENAFTAATGSTSLGTKLTVGTLDTTQGGSVTVDTAGAAEHGNTLIIEKLISTNAETVSYAVNDFGSLSVGITGGVNPDDVYNDEFTLGKGGKLEFVNGVNLYASTVTADGGLLAGDAPSVFTVGPNGVIGLNTYEVTAGNIVPSEIIADGGKLNIEAKEIVANGDLTDPATANVIEIDATNGGIIDAHATDLTVKKGFMSIVAGDADGHDVTLKSLATWGGSITDISRHDTGNGLGRVIFNEKVNISGTTGQPRVAEHLGIVVVSDDASVWESGAIIGENGMLVANGDPMDEAKIAFGDDLNLVGNGDIAIVEFGKTLHLLGDPATPKKNINVSNQGNLIWSVGYNEVQSNMALNINGYRIDDIGHFGSYTLGILNADVTVDSVTLTKGELALHGGGVNVATGGVRLTDEFVVRAVSSLYAPSGFSSIDPAETFVMDRGVNTTSHLITSLDLPQMASEMGMLDTTEWLIDAGLTDSGTIDLFYEMIAGAAAPAVPTIDGVRGIHGLPVVIDTFKSSTIAGTITIGGGHINPWITEVHNNGAPLPGTFVGSNYVDFRDTDNVTFTADAVLNITGEFALALHDINNTGVFNNPVITYPGLVPPVPDVFQNMLITADENTLSPLFARTLGQESMFGQFEFTQDTGLDINGRTVDYVYVSSADNNWFNDPTMTHQDRLDLANNNLRTAWGGTYMTNDFTDIVWNAVGEKLVANPEVSAIIGKAVIDPATGEEDLRGIFNYNNFEAIAKGAPAYFADESTFKYYRGSYAADTTEIAINSTRLMNEEVLKRTGLVRDQICALRNLSTTEGYAASILNQNFANRIWAGTFGHWEEASRRSGVSGYDYDAWGLNIGYDRIIGTSLVVGGMFTYTKGDYEDHAAYAHDSDIDSYAFNLYGTYSWANNFWATLYGGYTYADNDINELRRFGSETQTWLDWANADYHTNIWNIGANVGYDWKPLGNLIVTPSIGLNYVYADTSDHTGNVNTVINGTPVNVNNQRVSGVDNWALFLPIELAARYDWTFCEDQKLSIGAKAGYIFNFNDDEADGNVHYYGMSDPTLSAHVIGREASRHTLNLGADVRYSFKRFDIGVKYDYYKQSDWKSHRLMGTVGVSF